ncbi:MAG: RsmD family RNA methyltransferase [Chloroflexota bacterium]
MIAGVAGGRPLFGPPGPLTRPTADKVKGALFSMLETQLAAERPGEGPELKMTEIGTEEIWEGLVVLDLYAGTGALGIEALSRGAARCDFVEAHPAARRVIERNLRATGLADRARVIGMNAAKVARGAAGDVPRARYDLVLLDPPYNDQSVVTVIDDLANGTMLASGALVAVEHSRRVSLSTNYNRLVAVRERRYGDTVLSIYRQLAATRSGEARDGHDGDLSGNV